MKGKKKMIKLLGVVVLVSVVTVFSVYEFARGQQAQSEYIFKLNEAEINVISKGLGTQPFAEVAPIMQKMQKQFIEQQPKPKPVDPAKSDAEGREQLPAKPLKSE